MRNLYLGFSFALVAAAGCGGSDGPIHVPDAKMADAHTFMDARYCAAPATLPGGSIGTMAAPANRSGGTNFFHQDPMNMASPLEFAIGVKLDMTATPDVVYFIVPAPASGTWMVNHAYAFQLNPTAMTGDAFSFLDGDEDASGNAVTFYWPTSGTVTFSEISTAAGGHVFGTATMTPYKEIDPMSGADVPMGCATTFGGLQFFFNQTMAAARTETPTSPKADGSRLPAGMLKPQIDVLPVQ